MNTLFPVFFKLDKIKTLVVGGGYVGTEKVTAIFKNCPNANVTLVAPSISAEIQALSNVHPTLTLVFGPFDDSHLNGVQLVIVGTSLSDVQACVWRDAKKRNLMVNIADSPDKCDFYMSSIVQKSDLKIAISTNGKSPTLAMRLREVFESIIPNEAIQDMLDDLGVIRNNLKAYPFEEKAKELRNLTSMLNAQSKEEETGTKKLSNEREYELWDISSQ